MAAVSTGLGCAPHQNGHQSLIPGTASQTGMITILTAEKQLKNILFCAKGGSKRSRGWSKGMEVMPVTKND
jgi:hypothetical protein